MAPTLGELLAVPGLGLRVVAGAGPAALRRPVTWVAVSELADPTPYLQGGELVLLTGVLVGPEAGAGGAADYVGRLVEAGAAAIGFGIGVVHPCVPPGLVAAADAAGLPLVEVDRPTPFVAVGKALAGLLALERGEGDRRRLDAMRGLTAALARDPDPSGALGRLAGQVGGWAALLDPRGHVTAIAGRGARPDAARRLAARPGHASAADADDRGRVTVLPLGAPDRPLGYLAVGAAGELDHQLVAFAASLLTVDRAQARDTRAGRRWARATALAARLELPAPPPTAQVLGPLAGTGPVRALAVRAPLDAVLDALPGEDSVGGLPLDDGSALLLVPEAEVEEVVAAVAGLPGDVSGGLSAAVDPGADGAVAAAVARARSLAALGRGRVLRSGDAPPSVPELLARLDPAAAPAFADEVLAGLLAAEDAEVLTGSLAAYLSAHGALAVAAERLGVHRHTLRSRLRRIAGLLGRDLDDVAVRADLWVALSLRGTAVSRPPSAGTAPPPLAAGRPSRRRGRPGPGWR